MGIGIKEPPVGLSAEGKILFLGAIGMVASGLLDSTRNFGGSHLASILEAEVIHSCPLNMPCP